MSALLIPVAIFLVGLALSFWIARLKYQGMTVPKYLTIGRTIVAAAAAVSLALIIRTT
jgi:4-amino-4-deoxy-L-arabinose transferase-like glycosyltransferase